MTDPHDPIAMVLPKQYHWLLIWFDACIENMPNWVLICIALWIVYDCFFSPVYRFVVHPYFVQPLLSCMEDWKSSGGGPVLSINDIGDALGDPGSRLHQVVMSMLDVMSQERAIAAGLIDAHTKLNKLDGKLRDAEPRYNANEQMMTRLEDRLYNLEQRMKGKVDARLRQAITNVVVEVNKAAVETAIQRGLAKVVVLTRDPDEDRLRGLEEQVKRHTTRLEGLLEQEDRVREARTDMRQVIERLEATINSQTNTITTLDDNNNALSAANTNLLKRLSRLESTVVNNQQTQLQNVAEAASTVDALEVTLKSLFAQQYGAKLEKQSEQLKNHFDQLEELAGMKTSIDTLTEQHLEHESQLEQVKKDTEKASELQNQIGGIKLLRIEQDSVSKQIGAMGDRMKTLETANAARDADRRQIGVIPEIRAKLAGIEFAIPGVKTTSAETVKTIKELRTTAESTEIRIANLETRFMDLETDVDRNFHSSQKMRGTIEKVARKVPKGNQAFQGRAQQCEATISGIVWNGSIPTTPGASEFGSSAHRSSSGSLSPFAALATSNQAFMSASAGSHTSNSEHDDADENLQDMQDAPPIDQFLHQDLISHGSPLSDDVEMGGPIYDESGIPAVSSREFDNTLTAGDDIDTDGEMDDDAYGMCGDGH